MDGEMFAGGESAINFIRGASFLVDNCESPFEVFVKSGPKSGEYVCPLTGQTIEVSGGACQNNNCGVNPLHWARIESI